MTILQQGESLQFIGRLLRRAKGATNYEVIEDLSPYGVEISMHNNYKIEQKRFCVYKEAGGFYTDAFDTANIQPTTYTITAALLINDSVVVANNTVQVKIEQSKLGASIANALDKPTPDESSATTGSVEQGEWEYRIELACTGSDAAINGWSDPSEALSFALGVIVKGRDGVDGKDGEFIGFASLYINDNMELIAVLPESEQTYNFTINDNGELTFKI